MVDLINIGVLALQGSIAEHIKSLSLVEGVNPLKVKKLNDLEDISGLIIPGGESTTIGKMIKDFGLHKRIIEKAEKGMPVWGTCAGMILMAKKIVDQDYIHLGIMDISVRRNAYGSQLNSFSSELTEPEVSKNPIPIVFIRAPWVENVWGNVRILGRYKDRIIAVQQDNLLGTSFHPELTGDLSFHHHFVKMSKKYKETLKIK